MYTTEEFLKGRAEHRAKLADTLERVKAEREARKKEREERKAKTEKADAKTERKAKK